MAGTPTLTLPTTSGTLYASGGTDIAKADGGTGNSLGVTADVLYMGGAAIPSGFDAPINLGLAVSAGSSALTIALKGADGNDPSASNPVRIPFPNVTGPTGTPTWLDVTAATSLVVSSGSTLGVTSSTAFRLWVVGFNDGGTFRLGVIHCTTSVAGVVTIYPLSESAFASAVSEGGAGAADSAGVFYANATVTTKAYRILGYLEWSATGLTAGTWTTSALTLVRLFGPGVKKPGDVVQIVSKVETDNDSTTSATYVTTSLNASITPVSAANPINVSANGLGDNQAANRLLSIQMSQGTTAATNLIGPNAVVYNTGGRQISANYMETFDKPNTISAQAYAVQFNSGVGGAVIWGANNTVTMILREIMA